MSELPENWRLVTLGDFCEVKGGKRIPKSEKFEEHKTAYPYIRVSDFDNRSVSLESVRYISLDIHQRISQYTISSDDIYISIAGTIGVVGTIPDELNGANLTENAAKLTNLDAFDQRYLVYFLSSDAAQNHFRAQTVATSQPKLALFRIKTLQVPLPPLPEQQRIADKLDELLARVDGCRARLGRVPALVKRLRQAVLAAAVSGRLTEDWREENGVETDWSWTTFGEAGAVSGGLTKNAQRSLIETRKPYLRVANVYANRLELNDVAQIGLTDAEFAKTKLEKDDLLIVEGNGSLDQIGRAALWTGEIADCVHQNHIIRWRAFFYVLPSYALYWLLSPQGRASLVEVASSTTGLHTLSISKISAIPLSLPTIPEQHEIVRRVETLFAFADRLAARTAAAQARVEQLTPSLLAKAFRGEL